jgi:hypothetical protein
MVPSSPSSARANDSYCVFAHYLFRRYTGYPTFAKTLPWLGLSRLYTTRPLAIARFITHIRSHARRVLHHVNAR